MPEWDGQQRESDAVVETPALGRLGVAQPYYRRDNSIRVFTRLADALEAGGGQAGIDPAGAIEIVNRGYCFGTRTMFKGIGRVPAMAVVNAAGNGWRQAPLPQHDTTRADPATIADTLYHGLHAELRSACGDKRRIGLLLSGGMDSRVVACLLRDLQDSGEITADVVALTWGMSECRDVVYARKVAKGCGWEHRWFPLGPDVLLENIHEAARGGCEFSPLHLHAMPRIAAQTDIDIVVAGSFGDSVGRAEFSGSHVRRLKPVERHLYNRFKILQPEVFREFVPLAREDAQLYRRLYPRAVARQRYEIDHQLHYMQRMLTPCLSVISQRIPVYQAFTAPQVYGYMWSLDPAVRNDTVYRSLLELKAPDMLDIPWARTGLRYMTTTGEADHLARENNCYGLWMRSELRSEVRDQILSREIEELSIFNTASLRVLLRYTERKRNTKASQLQELLAWIAALAVWARLYDVRGPERSQQSHLKSLLDGHVISAAHAAAFDGKLNIQKSWRRIRRP